MKEKYYISLLYDQYYIIIVNLISELENKTIEEKKTEKVREKVRNDIIK